MPVLQKDAAGGPGGYRSEAGWQRIRRGWAGATVRPGSVGREEGIGSAGQLKKMQLGRLLGLVYAVRRDGPAPRRTSTCSPSDPFLPPRLPQAGDRASLQRQVGVLGQEREAARSRQDVLRGHVAAGNAAASRAAAELADAK